MSVKVNFINSQKFYKITPEIKKTVKDAVSSALSYENFNEKAEVNVTFTDDEQIRVLNNDFRGIDRSTDVLSFPLGENGEYDVNPENNALMLGDVVISTEHALNQGELYGHGIIREFAFLTVHSILHLLGYDHINSEEEETVMRKKQTEILENMGLNIKKGD